MTTWIKAAVAVMTLLTAASASGNETKPQPATPPANKAYLYTGGGLFLGSYTATAVLTNIAASEGRPNVDRNLYIPVIGPWLHLADSGATETNTTTDTVMVLGSGVIQGAGVALIVASFFIPERIAAATVQAGNVKMNLTPMSMGRAGSGLGAVGTF